MKLKIIKPFLIVFASTFLIYTSLFLGVYLTGINNLTLQSEDYIASATLPFSILKEKNLDLNEYYKLLTTHYPQPDDSTTTPYYLRKVADKYYPIRPILTSIIATPVYIIPTLLNLDNSIETIRIMSRIAGAFITALSTSFFYLILSKETKDIKKRIILLVIYALGTNSLSTSSQGLWQHGTSQLFLSAGLLAILHKRYSLSGLIFGLATIARPTNILSLGIFAIYILLKNQKARVIILYAILGVSPIILEMILNKLLFGTADNAGYITQFSDFRANILEGFTGLWVSPSKGILINSPILGFMIYGMYISIKKWKRHPLTLYLTVIVFLHTVLMGKWYSWYGGYSWGYRMASDVIPYMTFLLIPFVTSKYFKEKVWQYIFYGLTGISIGIHVLGIIFFDGIWHTIFDGRNKYWLWDINNSQILFSIKRLLAKIGLIHDPIQKIIQR